MGRRGPQPQPSALKIERGNPGHRPINEAEPDIEPLDPWAPPALVAGNAAALAEWKRLAPELVEKGVLAMSDLATFATYCQIVGDVHDLTTLIAQVGIGPAVQLGYVGRLDKQRVQLRLYAQTFGLTPASRSGVKAVKKPADKDDKKRRFFGARAG